MLLARHYAAHVGDRLSSNRFRPTSSVWRGLPLCFACCSVWGFVCVVSRTAVLSFGRGEIVALVEVLCPRACFDNVEMRGRQDSRTLFIAAVTAFADWEVCAVSDLFYELAW